MEHHLSAAPRLGGESAALAQDRLRGDHFFARSSLAQLEERVNAVHPPPPLPAQPVPAMQEPARSPDPRMPSEGPARTLGSVSSHRKAGEMSLTALYRFVATATRTKISQDASKMSSGHAPLEMVEFLRSQLLSMHGSRKKAARFLDQLTHALQKHRSSSPRLELFLRTSSLFSGADCLPASTHALVLDVLNTAVKMMTHTRQIHSPRAFYDPWSKPSKEIFVPASFLSDALHRALEMSAPGVRTDLLSWMRRCLDESGLNTPSACAASAASNEHSRRAVILGEGAPLLRL